MLNAQCEECYAICHIFGIKFKVVCEPNGLRLRHWIHQLWTVSPEGNVIRQVTIEDTNPEAWRAAIKRLLSDAPQVW
jgi:hypothetical protein